MGKNTFTMQTKKIKLLGNKQKMCENYVLELSQKTQKKISIRGNKSPFLNRKTQPQKMSVLLNLV